MVIMKNLKLFALFVILLIIGGCAERQAEVRYRKTAELKMQLEKERRQGIIDHEVLSGNPGHNAVALTFDDGPHPEFTPQILNILEKNGVKATFFVVGKMAEKYPELIRSEQAAGHQLGNHTYNHLNLARLLAEEIKAELLACNYVVKKACGFDMTYCRPPGGDYNRKVIAASSQESFKVVLWTDDPGDYADPGAGVIERRVLDDIADGGIILLHDGVEQTINVLPQIIKNIRQRGLKFVTIEQMNQWN